MAVTGRKGLEQRGKHKTNIRDAGDHHTNVVIAGIGTSAEFRRTADRFQRSAGRIANRVLIGKRG